MIFHHDVKRFDVIQFYLLDLYLNVTTGCIVKL